MWRYVIVDNVMRDEAILLWIILLNILWGPALPMWMQGAASHRVRWDKRAFLRGASAHILIALPTGRQAASRIPMCHTLTFCPPISGGGGQRLTSCLFWEKCLPPISRPASLSFVLILRCIIVSDSQVKFVIDPRAVSHSHQCGGPSVWKAPASAWCVRWSRATLNGLPSRCNCDCCMLTCALTASWEASWAIFDLVEKGRLC